MTRVRGAKGRLPPAERLARALMSDSDAGVILVDPAGRVHELNDAAARLFGLSSARARRSRAVDLLRTVIAGDDPARDAFRRAATERDVVLITRSGRSEEHTSELQSLSRISYAVFCLKKKK